jgi:hypothetical protein
MIELAYEFDVNLERVELEKGIDSESHYILMCQYQNVIAWVNYGVPFDVQSRERNTLYFENGLLNRGYTYFLDDNGYGNYSNIVSRKDNCKKYSTEYQNHVVATLKGAGFIFEQLREQSKIVVIGLQGNGSDEKLLQNCIKYLPKCKKIIVRPHPNQIPKCKKSFDESGCESLGYIFDETKSAFDSLIDCEALIVNNSALMFKGLTMGKKVAACERGVYSGSSAVLDCSRNPSLLKHIFSFVPNEEATLNLLCGIQINSVPREANPQDLLYNTNFANWLIRIRR